MCQAHEWVVMKEGSTCNDAMHEVCEQYSMENCVKLHLMSATIVSSRSSDNEGISVCPVNVNYRKRAKRRDIEEDLHNSKILY